MFKNVLILEKNIKHLQTRCFHLTKGNRKTFSKWYQSLWVPQTTEPPYSHVTQIGDPVLRQRAEEVPREYINSKELNLILETMTNVLHKYNCVGLAAPQIGIPLRIIALEFHEKLKDQFSENVYKVRQMEILPLTILINPELKVTNYNKKSFVESCASVKGYSAVVDRFEEIRLTGLSKEGDEKSLDLKGWNARIAQHEMDHLEGKLYTDKMDRTTFTCTCWQAVNSRAGRVEIPFHK